MFISWCRTTRSSRSRIITSVACLAGVLGVFAYFWKDVCYWRADAAFQQRRTAAAAAWVARGQWFRRTPDANLGLLQLQIARRQQNFPEVERLLQQASQLGISPREIQRERLLAMAQTNQFSTMSGRWGELLNDQRSDGPEIARAYYTWAMLNHNLNLAEKTLKLWQQDYPQDPEPWGLTGRYHQSMNNWEGAEEAYRQAQRLAPDNDEYRLALANALQNRLKAADAIVLYEQHLQKHPQSLEALHGIAQCAATDGDMETAVRVMRTAMEASPDDFSTRKLYGEILLSAGDAATAVTVLEKAHREVPEHANLAYTLGRALKECGRGAEAEPLFAFMEECRPQLDRLLAMERELRRQPNNLTLRMQIAGITAKYVSRRDAIRWYQNILLVSPNYAPAHQALAELYRLVGDEKLTEYHSNYASANLRSANSETIPVQGAVLPAVETSKAP